VDHQQLGVLRYHRRRVARLVGDDRHLPEELARPQDGQDLLHVPDLLGDGDPPRLEDEHLLTGLSLAEEHRSLGEFLPESLKEGLFGTHGKRPPEHYFAARQGATSWWPCRPHPTAAEGAGPGIPGSPPGTAG